MNIKQTHGQKNTSIISSTDLERIRRYASTRRSDEQAVDPVTASFSQKHQRALEMTGKWSNSITNNRKARLTRLQELQDEHELELQAVDAEEKSKQKEMRKKALVEAENKKFMEKPEIRAVHAQLLLHEVQKEREQQILLKERKRQMEQEREDYEAKTQAESIRQAEQKEIDLARQRRERNIQAAQEFRRQKEENEQRRMREKEEAAEDEMELAREAKRQLDEENALDMKRREREQQNVRDIVKGNETMLAFRERSLRIEQLEDDRIRQQSIAIQDEQDRREADQRAKRAQKQAAIDALIISGQNTLEQTKSRQRTFEDTQYGLQFEKDRKAIVTEHNKQERLRQERRQDYLDAQAKLEAKKRMRKAKATFPIDEETIQASGHDFELEQQKMSLVHDIASFQRQQVQEKKEREAAAKERERLEFQRQIELEDQKTAEAQEYATEMLTSMRRY